ncbi:hypothetical protein APSETT445_004763 [Aspergillus pseudonomiae]
MDSKFNPYYQNLTFHAADGTPFQVPVMMLDDFYQYCIQICINYGAQFGASVIIFIILLLLTRPDKRGSSVFFLNSGALLLNMGRLLCHMIYFTTDFVKAYQYFSGDYSRAPTSAYANSILGVILTTLLLICIETSLVLQVQVVCANLRRQYRTVLLCVSILVALIPVGFRLGYMVENCKTIVGADNPLSLVWLESATNIVITISICFFCSIFITKLGFAIRQRRRLGVRDFGPMKDHYDPRQTYQDPNRTYYDVASVLAQYPSLSPRTEVYTYENGFSALLLQLTGTVPVTFRGTVYKFPISLWVPNTYPREPPIVYVTPTQDMAVRVGQHVTLEGRVYHHYLAHWAEAWERPSSEVQPAVKPKAETPDLLTSPFEVELPSFAPGPAPPIPPNPEKDALLHAVSKALAATLQTNVSQTESAARSLQSQSDSLHAAIATLQGEISSLNTLNSSLQSNTSILQQSLHRADAVIADAQSRISPSAAQSSLDPVPSGLPPIDEVLVAPTVVGKQLYDLVAEERGIQQAIYALQTAHVKGVIGVETWSRHTRGLAREAFLKRALIRKIGKGMGLDEYQM